MIHNPKFVFFGTPEFAAIILQKLIQADFVPAVVVCNPDKPVGRKQIIIPPLVKQRIMNYESRIRNQIKILQPEKLDKNFYHSLFTIHNAYDLFIVAAYAKILPKEILEIPRLGSIGVHPSLLPKYRGPSPIQTTILNGDEKTGTTLYLIDERVDHGPILAQRELNDELRITNYELLTRKLAELSAELLIDFLRKLNQYLGSPTPKKLRPNTKEVELPEIGIKLHPQNEAIATYTKKFTTEDAYIAPADLEKAQKQGGEIAIEIDRKIRALNPEPNTWTILNGKRTKILEAKLIDEKLKITKIQVEGKKPQNI